MKIVSFFITLITFVSLSAVFPFVAWFIVISVFQGLELVTGYRVPLVSQSDRIELGAILVVVFYLCLCGWAVYRCYVKRLDVCVGIVGIGAFLVTPYVFSMVRAIIWF